MKNNTTGAVTSNEAAHGVAPDASCSFTVTVNDTQPPVITCPGNVTTTAGASCPIGPGKVVTYPPPVASDNCAVQSVVCNPPSGSTFPVGSTAVACTATDTSSLIANCTFTVTVFGFCLQDESNPGNFVLIHPTTGDYIFYCDGNPVASGRGTLNVKACIGSIDHTKGNRRVHIQWDTTAQGGKGAGTASVQRGPTIRCQITDKNMSNNTCTVSPPPLPQRLAGRRAGRAKLCTDPSTSSRFLTSSKNSQKLKGEATTS